MPHGGEREPGGGWEAGAVEEEGRERTGDKTNKRMYSSSITMSGSMTRMGRERMQSEQSAEMSMCL